MTTMTPTAQHAEKERLKLSREALNRVNKLWPDGVELTSLKDTKPHLDGLLSAAADKLNEAWQSARRDMITMAEFKASLQAWEYFHYQVIQALAKGGR